MVALTFARCADGGIFARHLNRRYPVFQSAIEKVESYFRLNQVVVRVRALYDENSHQIEAVFPNPIRLALISSTGIIDESGKGTSVPSLGLWKFAQNLNNSVFCADIQVVDPNIATADHLRNFFTKNIFDVIGLSMIPANIKNDLRTAAYLLKLQPRAKFVIGGISSQALVDLGIAEALGAMIVIGPGEAPMKGILESIAMARDPAFKSIDCGAENSGIIIREIPFEKSDLVHDGFYPKDTIYVHITNQCCHNCFWCSSPKSGPFYNTPGQAIREIKRMVADSKADIVIADNDFSFNSTRSLALCNLLIREGIANRKHCKSSVAGMTKELLDGLKRANFRRVAYGVESFDRAERQSLGKNFHDYQLRGVLEETLRLGIIPEINLIIFSPFATRDSVRKNLECCAEWSERGAHIFSTFGLYAVPGYLKKDLPYMQETIFYRGMKKEIVVPHLYEPAAEIKPIFNSVWNDYYDHQGLTALPNHAKSILKLKYVAQHLKLASLAKRFQQRFEVLRDERYVNV